MKLSMSISYINTALNYPALAYEDLNVFFDMAIAELNTTLHTAIPTVSKMTEEFRQKLSKQEDNKVLLETDPKSTNDFSISTDDTDPYYYSPTTHKFYILNNITQEYEEFSTIKGVYVGSDGVQAYQSAAFGDEAVWMEIPMDPIHECDLDEYLPDEWVLLWMIPYVCFKYTVRDGGTAQTFSEELTQGFQQLQETYDVPYSVLLATYADMPAYRSLVEKYLPNLNIKVRTRAIYPSMKHARNLNAVFGGFYDRGGF